MKLTQELIATIVFLIGSWVVLSVVAVAFPPSASSIRQALSKHATSARKSEPVISPEAIAEPATTYYQNEKIPVVQVVSGNPEKNEIFILAENESIPEKMIEENPTATLAVLGGDEVTANRHIEKFNIAAKNVAIKLALAKETAVRQAEADNRKLQEWKEWCERKGFAIEIQTKKFELPIQKLNHASKTMAEQPVVVLPDTGLESPVDDTKAHAKINKKQKNNNAEPQMSEWNQAQLQTAMKFAGNDKVKYSVYKQTKAATNMPVKQNVNAAFAKAAKTVAAVEQPRFEALNEKLGLTVKGKSYHLTGMPELSAPLAALAAESNKNVNVKPVQIAEQTVKAAPAIDSQAVSKKLALKSKVLAQENNAQPVKADKQADVRAVPAVKPVEAKRAVAVAAPPKAYTAAPVTQPIKLAAASTFAPLAAPSIAGTMTPPAATVAPAVKVEAKAEPKVVAKIEPKVAAKPELNVVPQLPAQASQQQVQTEAPVVTIVKGPVTAEAKPAPAIKAQADAVFKPVVKRFVPDQATINANQTGVAKRVAANAKPKIVPQNFSAEQLAAIERAKIAKHEKFVKRERAIRNLEKQLETEPMNISQPQVAERIIKVPEPARVATHQAAPHARYQERQRPASVARRQPTREEHSMHQDNSNDFNDDFQASSAASGHDPMWEYETYGYAREFNDAEEYSHLMQD